MFTKANKSREHFKLILEKTLQSLEENGINFVLKAKQKKATEQFYEKRIVLLARRARNYASDRLVITPLFRIISDQIMEGWETMNLTARYLAQKLVCALTESVTDFYNQ